MLELMTRETRCHRPLKLYHMLSHTKHVSNKRRDTGYFVATHAADGGNFTGISVGNRFILARARFHDSRTSKARETLRAYNNKLCISRPWTIYSMFWYLHPSGLRP